MNLHSVQLQHNFTIVVQATSLADELVFLLVLTFTVINESGSAPGGFSTEDTCAGLSVSPLVPSLPDLWSFCFGFPQSTVHSLHSRNSIE